MAASARGPEGRPGLWRRHRAALAFLAPAAIFLGIWIVYPAISTVVRSFFDRSGSEFVGLDNYEQIVTTDILITAIRNNALWLAVVPALVTAVGLVFGVLIERIRWSVAFRTAVFMPMAISLFAAGVIWRVMDQRDPEVGAVNAALAAVADTVDPPGALTGATGSTERIEGTPQQGLRLARPLRPGAVARLGLTGVALGEIPEGAVQARAPPPLPDGIAGLVWVDFLPGGGRPGVVEKGEQGLPSVSVQLRERGGGTLQTVESEPDGSFAFEGIEPGAYTVAIASETFEAPFAGVDWLGPELITPAVMIAYIWVWAGFAMVVIGAGLAALPRDVLEAARTDGASEAQVFRRVTVPLLRPVLIVVFVTMLINVLKVFDIVLSVAPASSQDEANVIALAMWRTAFGGVNDFGLGSAIAVLLFLLVIPLLAFNLRNFRREV